MQVPVTFMLKRWIDAMLTPVGLSSSSESKRRIGTEAFVPAMFPKLGENECTCRNCRCCVVEVSVGPGQSVWYTEIKY